MDRNRCGKKLSFNQYATFDQTNHLWNFNEPTNSSGKATPELVVKMSVANANFELLIRISICSFENIIGRDTNNNCQCSY